MDCIRGANIHRKVADKSLTPELSGWRFAIPLQRLVSLNRSRMQIRGRNYGEEVQFERRF
jgi:hypothetical protein